MNKIGETHLTHQTKFRLNELTKIENCFNQEINQRELSKYVAAFDYMDKILILLSATGGGDCIFSTVSAVVAPIGIAGASFTLIFSLTT